MKTEVTISRVGLEGQGVAHDPAGNIYFVPGMIPGDVVEVECDDNAKRYRDARVLRLVTPSPDRQESPCAYFQRCGGCDWLHWRYEAQLKAKDAMLDHLFERNELVPAKRLPILGAISPLGYRNRIQLRREGRALGFFARRSHDIVDIERCAVARPEINTALTELRKESAPADRKKIELALTASGVERWEDAPHGAGGFVQVNAEQNEVLRGSAAREVAGAHRVLELFCGNGNLTSAFAAQVGAVLGVDSSSAAITAAIRAPNVTFLEAPVSSSLLNHLPKEWKDGYDTLLLDPPRSGAGDLQPFLHPRLEKIVYVSCSPIQFAKEASILKRAFRFESAQAIDMFPHTRHIEFVATFRRL